MSVCVPTFTYNHAVRFPVQPSGMSIRKGIMLRRRGIRRAFLIDFPPLSSCSAGFCLHWIEQHARFVSGGLLLCRWNISSDYAALLCWLLWHWGVDDWLLLGVLLAGKSRSLLSFNVSSL